MARNTETAKFPASVMEVSTIEDLIMYTRLRGIPKDTESIIRMQDIIGHTEIGKLDKIANNQLENPNGNKMETGKQFYSILFHVWNWEDATQFYNTHTNPAYIAGIEAKRELENHKEQLKKVTDLYRECGLKLTESIQTADKQRKRAEAAEAENIKLKAMLFDMMMKERTA